MTVPPWIRSRWVIVPGILLVTIALWNLYVATHDHGVVEGRVVDAGGRPVAGATVTLYERSFVAYTANDTTTTGPDGMFRFTSNRHHALQLQAETPALGQSDRRPLRLWFRSQDLSLTDPLQLPGRLP